MKPIEACYSEARIEKAVSVSSVQYKITGELKAVFDAIDKLFDKYQARGYGTACHLIVEKTDGQYEAHVSRATNCD